MRHRETHRIQHVGWLRAAVLGANDGIVSTASLILGVAASGAGDDSVLLTGIAGLVAGAMSMAAGEYVSVSSQADAEAADLERERHELATTPEQEHRELTAIYVGRGLDQALAEQVASQLTSHDALGAHGRDELGITDEGAARPVQATFASAASFAAGAALPLGVVVAAPPNALQWAVAGGSLLSLGALGALSAKVGGASIGKAALRVTFWGALAMGITSAVGALFGVAV
jgi:vacuolar iron transporter family protein